MIVHIGVSYALLPGIRRRDAGANDEAMRTSATVTHLFSIGPCVTVVVPVAVTDSPALPSARLGHTCRSPVAFPVREKCAGKSGTNEY